jgi:hypothetical protein
VTHFVYLIRARKVGATRRLRDRLREQGHDLPHRVTDDGWVLAGDPDVEVLAVYTGQSDERIGDAEWAFARAHRLSRETFGDRAMMSERGRRGAAVSNARRVRCPPAGDGPATRRARRGGTDRGSAGDGSASEAEAPQHEAEECWTGPQERPCHSPLRTPSDENDARNQWPGTAVLIHRAPRAATVDVGIPHHSPPSLVHRISKNVRNDGTGQSLRLPPHPRSK